MSDTKHDHILQTVGRTPVVRIHRLAPPEVRVYVKVESFNPMGSVKDRLALGVIEDAERRGLLKPGQTVVEATSGNTGIGLAMVCAQKGYPLVLTMAENFSVERRKMMRFLGAKVVLTPATARGTGMLAKAVELAEKHGWFLCRQFDNEANANIHSQTTAQEILSDFDGDRLDYWVTGFGTGGTLKGVARVLKEKRADTRIVVCEPDNSRILHSGIEQPRAAGGSIAESHPCFRTHVMQGWAPDFIPKLAEDAVERRWIDDLVAVSGNQAMETAQQLARQEGIFTGITGGATLAGALALAQNAPAGTTILAMLPDTGERYLSTPLFSEVLEEMSAEEEEISKSTPQYRFDVCPASGPTGIDPEAATDKARAFVDAAVADAERPVVMFALEWCEFCWAVRKLFGATGVPYRSVDMDSAENQKDDWGADIRSALAARTGLTTAPQVFVGGDLVGGSTEVLEAWESGRFQEMLAAHGVAYDLQAKVDARSFLPSWLHSRAET